MKLLLGTLLVGALSFASATQNAMQNKGPYPKEYEIVLNALNAKLDNYREFVKALEKRKEHHNNSLDWIIPPLPIGDSADKPAEDPYDEKLLTLCKTMKVGLTNVIDNVKDTWHGRYSAEISRIESTGDSNSTHHIKALEKFYALSLKTLHKETAGLPELSLAIVDKTGRRLGIKKCIDRGLAELKKGLLDKLEHLCDQFYGVLQSEKDMNFADHMETLEIWSDEIKKGSLKETKSKQTEHLSEIMNMLRKYQTEPTHTTIKKWKRGNELVVREEYHDKATDFRLAEGEKVTVSYLLESRMRESDFNIFKTKMVRIVRSDGRSAIVPASIFAPWEKSSLWQICHQICDLVLKDGAGKTVTGSKYAIRPVPKKGARMFTKGVRKYGMNFSKVTDSFGCEIVTADYDHHVKVLGKLFESFKGKGQLFNVNGNMWRIQLQKVKLNLSSVASDVRKFQIRSAYVDDKVIFHATKLVEQNGKYVDSSDILRMESIIMPRKIKDLKAGSHEVYDTVRELGSLIGGQLNRFCAEYVMDKMHADLKSDLSAKRVSSELEVQWDGEKYQWKEISIGVERKYRDAKKHGINEILTRCHSLPRVRPHQLRRAKHHTMRGILPKTLTSEEFLRKLRKDHKSVDLVPTIDQKVQQHADKDDIARCKKAMSEMWFLRQLYKRVGDVNKRPSSRKSSVSSTATNSKSSSSEGEDSLSDGDDSNDSTIGGPCLIEPILPATPPLKTTE